MSSGLAVEGPDGGWGWMVVIAAGTTDALITSFTYGMSPFYIEFRRYFNTTAAQTSWVVSLQQLSFLLAFVGTYSADRIGARKTLMVFGCIAAIGTFTAQFATSIYFLHTSLGFITGLGFAGCLAPAHVTNAKYFPKRYPLANGLAVLGSGVGLFVFPPFFQICIDRFGWRGALMVEAGVLTNLCVCGAILRPLKPVRSKVETGNIDGKSSGSLKDLDSEGTDTSKNESGNLSYFSGYLVLFHNRRFLSFTVSLVLLAIAYGGIMLHWQPRAAVNNVGTLQQTSFLVSICGITSLVGRLGGGLLVHFKLLSPISTWILSGTILGIACVIPQLAHTYIGYVILSVFIGLGSGLCFASFYMCCRDLVRPEQVSHSFSCLFLVDGIGLILGPPFAGKIYDVSNNYDITYFVLGSLMFLSGLILVPGQVLNRLRQIRASKNMSIK